MRYRIEPGCHVGSVYAETESEAVKEILGTFEADPDTYYTIHVGSSLVTAEGSEFSTLKEFIGEGIKDPVGYAVAEGQTGTFQNCLWMAAQLYLMHKGFGAHELVSAESTESLGHMPGLYRIRSYCASANRYMGHLVTHGELEHLWNTHSRMTSPTGATVTPSSSPPGSSLT